jgi:general secretion pathway protein A
MYTTFFGFKERPFDVTPDPKFLYLSPEHTEMLASLVYGISQRRGFITVIGEAGTGKTTLLNATLDRLDPKTQVAYIFNTDVSFEELLTMTLMELGLARAEGSLYKLQALDRLNRFATEQMAKGGNVVLIVDEAQNLDHRMMENLRLLSNLETRKQKLIQIVFSGQPELDRKLSHPSLRQLAQRISLRRYITALGERQTYEYVQHRLGVAGYRGPRLFKGRAQELIWRYSGGIPRKINILCDNALLIAFGLSNKKCSTAVMEEAIRDLSWSPFSHSWLPGTETLPGDLIPAPKPSDASAIARHKYVSAVFIAFAACLVFLLGLSLGKFSFSQRANTPIEPKALVQGKIIKKSIVQSLSGLTVAATPVRTGIKGSDGTGGSKDNNAPLDAPAATGDTPSGQEASRLFSPKDKKIHKGSLTAPLSDKGPPPHTTPMKRQAGIRVTPEKTNAPLKSLPHVIAVKPGDRLYDIIRQTYGTYNESLVNTVLRENPAILSADQIFVGQRITLPQIQEQGSTDNLTTTSRTGF